VFALLRTRRWIGFSALVIVAIIGFAALSYWQWSRAEQKRADRLELASVVESTPVSVAEAREPWQRVELEGTFRDETTLVVRQRPLQGFNGLWVLTLLETADGQTVWVNRGWTPAGQDARQIPDVPSAPLGTVRIIGAWVPDEAGARVIDGLPAGMIAGVSAATLPQPTSVSGFVHVQRMNPNESFLESINPPQINEGQNLSYAFQWLAFAGIASFGWWFMLRREARDHVS
jgi:cytochrome oxidase assembly protein ShyY1